MNGFIDNSLNDLIAESMLNNIIVKVLISCNHMISDCVNNNVKLENNEPKIKDYLFFNYLNNDDFMQKIGFDVRFSSEMPENYVDGSPIGRADLQVYSEDAFHYRKRYFIIECKRIGGTSALNHEYINEGIRRFIGEKPKYSSYYKRNAMLGFVVKNIDIGANVDQINKLLSNKYTDIGMRNCLCVGAIENTYISTHSIKGDDYITLSHAFVNYTAIIQ